MKNNKTYRIVKVTLGDRTKWFEVQKKSWFGKWDVCRMNKFTKHGVLFDVPAQFEMLKDAEKFIARNFVDPIVEVIKEY